MLYILYYVIYYIILYYILQVEEELLAYIEKMINMVKNKSLFFLSIDKTCYSCQMKNLKKRWIIDRITRLAKK